MNRITKSLLVVCLSAAAWVASLGTAGAQVAVYHIEFEKSGSSINFSFFNEALFVAEGLGGTGSFIFAFVEGGRDFYLTSEDSAEFFFATKPGKSRAVIRATSDNNTGLSHYLAIGDLDSKLTVNIRGQIITFNVATSLNGHVLASDPETDEEFSARDGSIGFAGMATMKARLDRQRTDNANAASQSVSQAIQSLVAELESRGFSDGTAVDDGGDGTDGGEGGTDPGDGTDTGTLPAGEVSG